MKIKEKRATCTVMHKHEQEELTAKQAAYKIQLDFYFFSLPLFLSLPSSHFALRFCALILIACSFSNQADKRSAFPNAAFRLGQREHFPGSPLPLSPALPCALRPWAMKSSGRKTLLALNFHAASFVLQKGRRAASLRLRLCCGCSRQFSALLHTHTHTHRHRHRHS